MWVTFLVGFFFVIGYCFRKDVEKKLNEEDKQDKLLKK